MDELQVTETKEMVIIEAPELKEIDESRAAQIKAVFAPMVDVLESFEEQYKNIITMSQSGITHTVTAKAKVLRISISKVRIESEKLRKSQKEDILRAGRAIDGVGNILKWAVTEKEDTLKAIENHFEIELKKKQDAIQLQRSEELKKYTSAEIPEDLYSMSDDVWNAYLDTKKKEREDVLAAEKAAKDAKEETARAEREERSRLQVENDRLRNEQAERARRDQIEKDKQIKIDLEEIEVRAKIDLSEKAEREKRERAEKELADIKAADRRKAEEAEKQVQKELNRGDADKMKALVSELSSIISKYEFKSHENKFRRNRANAMINMAIHELEKES